uniref:acyl carrier protein n=1 Tax=Candidatus Fimivicinus sp. TaxID=3056640 RepID=UPI003FF0B924
MTKETIIETIKNFLRENLSGTFNDADANLMEAGMDSLTTIKLIIHLENTFHFSYEDDDLLEENFKTMNIIADYIKKTV